MQSEENEIKKKLIDPLSPSSTNIFTNKIILVLIQFVKRQYDAVGE